MSKNGKIDYSNGNDNREDIQWFENFEKYSKTKYFERLKNEDILNYIKDIERNCRLEVSSGDEDYAGTKKSSNCSVRSSGTQFRSFKKIKSRVTSRKNKNMALKRKIKQFSGNATNACNYCCSTRKSHLRANSDLTVRKNSRRDLNVSAKSVYQIHQPSNLSRNSNKYQESSPTLYGWYSRENQKTWPAATEMTSLEVIEDRSQNAIRDSRISKSKVIENRKSAKINKSLHRSKFDDTYYMSTPNIARNKKTTERNPCSQNHKYNRKGRMRKLNEESSVDNFEHQQPLNKIYSGRETVFSYQAPLQNGDYKRYYTSGYRYPVRRSKPPTSWSLSSRSNRLTTPMRLPETSSLLQKRTSQWENATGLSLKASSSSMGVSIDRNYQRKTNYKNNMDQRLRRPDILGDRESLCYRRPGLLRECGKLCKVLPTYENKQWFGYCCENVERDEVADYSRYCRCPENADNLIRVQRESTYQPVPMSKQFNQKSVQPRDKDEEESEIYLSMEEDSQNEGPVCDNAFDFDDIRTNDYDDADLRDLKPRISFHHRARRNSNKWLGQVARKELNNGLKSSQEEAIGARSALQKKITARYPAGKEFSFAIRTPEKPVSGDSLGLRYDETKYTCECKEPFHDPPAACSIDPCTCIGNGENAEKNNSDSSRRIYDVAYCCCCRSCLSSTSNDEKDPVKKLESFCERVKAVNQNIFRKPSKSTYRDTTRSEAQEYDSDENQFGLNKSQKIARVAKAIERKWLTDPIRLRLEKPKSSHGGANLEKILIYPPRGEGGPPLTLYKRSSNISCRVKGNADTGFRYSVTYVQKFISPTWMPSLSPEILSRETDKECDCSSDYG